MYQKYHNTKIKTEDGTFDSKKEYFRWEELKLMQKAGLIQNLRRQVPYVLIPAQKNEAGKVIERQVVYKADFFYTQNGTTIVEDVKGIKTPEYIIKRKLMLYVHGIVICEV